MNIHSPNTEKYISSTDAVSKFPEKCTAIAARLNDYQELEVFIPFGTDDLINFRVSPTPHYFSDKERQTVYNERVKKEKLEYNMAKHFYRIYQIDYTMT